MYFVVCMELEELMQYKEKNMIQILVQMECIFFFKGGTWKLYFLLSFAVNLKIS